MSTASTDQGFQGHVLLILNPTIIRSSYKHPDGNIIDMPNNSQDCFDPVRTSLDGVMPDLDGISNEVNRLTESIEKHFKTVASNLLEYPVAASIRKTIQSSPWLYEEPPRPPPSRRIVPMGYFEACQRWVSEHRAVTAAAAAFVGTGACIIWRRRKADRTKRRAKRAKNGSRTEVVVVAGSPHSPLTKSLSQDLERRGFIVYIPVHSLSEEQLVQSEARADIRPLHIDITSDNSTAAAIQKLSTHLTTSYRPHLQAAPHTLHLASFVLIPPLSLHTQPVIGLPPSFWADTFNAHFLSQITILRAFLALLISQKATLLFLTPSIVPSLTPASHAPETVISTALIAYIATLRREIPFADLRITKLKLGNFDYGPMSGAERQLVDPRTVRPSKGGEPRTGSSLRELHNCVFDIIARGKGRNGTVFVGQGSWIYDVVGKWVPSGVVGWMMGLREVRERGTIGPGWGGGTPRPGA